MTEPNGQGGGYSPSNPDGGDAPAPRDAIGELERAPVRIGTPVHLVVFGNPSGAPCAAGSYLGFDGRDAWVMDLNGRPFRAPYEMPGAAGPGLTYGTFHLAARCEITGPVDPPQPVRMSDGPDETTDIFRTEGQRRA